MNKNIKILLVVIFLAAIAAFLVFTQNKKGSLSKSDSDFAVKNEALVSKIFLSDKQDNQVLVEKQKNGKWLINKKHKVSDGAIEVFLNGISSLKVLRPLNRSAHDNIVKLMAVKSTKVEIYESAFIINFFSIRLLPYQKLAKVYYVGDHTMDNMGTFMLMEGSENIQITYIPGFRGYVGARYMIDETRWRDKKIFRYDINQIKQVKVEFFDSPKNSYKIEIKENIELKITALKSNQVVNNYDTLRVYEFLSSFNDVNFENVPDYLNQKQIDSVISENPFHIISLLDVYGNNTEIKTFRKKVPKNAIANEDGEIPEWDLDRMFALIKEDDFVIVQYFYFDKITRTLPYLQGKQ